MIKTNNLRIRNGTAEFLAFTAQAGEGGIGLGGARKVFFGRLGSLVKKLNEVLSA